MSRSQGEGARERTCQDVIEMLCHEIEEAEERATVHMRSEEERKWREWISEGIDKRGFARPRLH